MLMKFSYLIFDFPSIMQEDIFLRLIIIEYNKDISKNLSILMQTSFNPSISRDKILLLGDLHFSNI